MDETIKESELAEIIRKHGFAAIMEVAADIHTFERSRCFPGRKSRVLRYKNQVRKIARDSELVAGFCYYSYYFKSTCPQPVEFVVRLASLEKAIVEAAYERAIETCGKLKDDERKLATKLYNNRERILLASLHEGLSSRERFIARDIARLAAGDFDRRMGAIRGAVAESYLAILFRQQLETADIVAGVKYTQNEQNPSSSRQTHQFEIDLIIACPERDFYSALSSLSKKNNIHVGLSPELNEKLKNN